MIYMRIHGREGWYSYDYSQKEIEETARKISESGPDKVYVYFNNDHNMLEDARLMLRILSAL